IGHGLGMVYTGDDPSFGGVTVYDTFVQNGTFIGQNAEFAYRQFLGNFSGPLTPLPLEAGNLSHLSESSSLGSDLMSPTLSRGFNAPISPIDFAILQDLGVPLNLPTSGNNVLHNFYSVDLHMLAGDDTGYAI